MEIEELFSCGEALTIPVKPALALKHYTLRLRLSSPRPSRIQLGHQGFESDSPTSIVLYLGLVCSLSPIISYSDIADEVL